MDGLTAKVFRTYNASITLQEQLDQLTNGLTFFILPQSYHIFNNFTANDSIHEKLLSYNRKKHFLLKKYQYHINFRRKSSSRHPL
jgi:hypothetical protein